MFEHIFGKGEAGATGVAVPDQDKSQTMDAETLIAWRSKLDAASADDTALLQLLPLLPTPELKLAAVAALRSEDAVKRAMRESRDHDKRVHRAARSRWMEMDGRRAANEEADELTAAALALLAQDSIPANRVAEMDRAWAEIDKSLLKAGVSESFSSLREQLGAKLRARGESVQTVLRWVATTAEAVARLRDSLRGVAEGSSSPSTAAQLATALLELTGGAPDVSDARCQSGSDTATRTLALASSVVQRAEFLLQLPAAGSVDAEEEKRRDAQWRSFPDVSSADLQTVLAERYADWRNAESSARQHELDARRAREREVREEKNKARAEALLRDAAAAEAALAAGNVAELNRLMSAIERLLKAGSVNAALAQRIEILHQEQKRLRDWQRWSGKQGREQLVADAQALAAQAGGKVAIKAHAEAIEKLRQRWKEIDKLGGATNQTLWLAFDGALKSAYAPVAAHLERLKVARQENLAARNRIIDDLTKAAATHFPPPGENATAVDWRAVARSLDDAQTAWRKLGPLEHTVPRKALDGGNGVAARYTKATQALAAPLEAMWRDATARREKLIADARMLASDAMARDAVDKVRALQVQWQTHAKAVTLPRRDENRLWTDFKAATDAIFAARDAARKAKDAELDAKAKVRAEIVERLAALPDTSSAADVRRAMAEAEAAWRAAPPAPKHLAAKLDARYRAARDGATKRMARAAAHAAQARYDALMARLVLCQEREDAMQTGSWTPELQADLESRWNAVEGLPETWSASLNARFKGEARSNDGLPETLLNLEVGCGMESPPEFAAQRQQLKLRALKNAMEGRQSVATTADDIERWLLAAAGAPSPDESARLRLERIIAAVRARR